MPSGVLGAALAAGCTTMERSGSQPPPLAEFRARLAAACASGTFSGIVAVERKGRLLLRERCGTADPQGQQQIEFNDRFKLFSISKSVTAMAILRLVESGRMQLDAPLSAYVEQVPQPWRPVTIKQLLQHSSGIADHTQKLVAAYQNANLRTHAGAMRHVLASLSGEEARLQSAPGSTWRYSNFGYELLALAAEEAEGRPFHEVVRRSVLLPAGMRDAVTILPDPDPAKLDSLPVPRLVAGFNGAPQRREVATSYSFIQQGAGALAATAGDMLAFGRALAGGRLVSRARLAAMEADSMPVNPQVRYGYGLMVRAEGNCTYWQHSGGTNGFVTEFAVAPAKGITVVILSNVGFAEVSPLRSELMRTLLQQEGCGVSPGG